jgi:hypothetical protein
MPDPVQFFDSHGDLWESCPCDHPKAHPSGPNGAPAPSRVFLGLKRKIEASPMASETSSILCR